MLRHVDRYLFGQAARRYLAVIVVVVLMLALENVHRLAADLVETTGPLHLLGRLSLLLTPEHLAIANPIALFLGVALTVRALTLRGEWQMFAASGLSPARTLAAPMLLALLATGIQLGDRMSWRPAGERGLDALYREIATGEHGTPVPTREPLSLDPATTMIAEGASREQEGIVLHHVLIHQSGDVLYAPHAAVMSGARGGFVLDMRGGTAVHSIAAEEWRSVGFSHFHVGGTPPGLGMIDGNTRQQLDRLGVGDLWQRAGDGDAGATAAFVARIESGLFLLLLPWLGMTLGAPPLRRHGGAGLFVGILLIVGHQQLGALVEDRFADSALAAGVLHLMLWAGIVAGAKPGMEAAGRWGRALADTWRQLPAQAEQAMADLLTMARSRTPADIAV